jgi:Domain of unknown function (DUF4410)
MRSARARGRACKARLAFLIPALLLVCSCSADLAVVLVKPPPEAPAQLVVGDIDAEDPEARRLARFMRAALLDRLLRAQAFAVIYDRDGRGAGIGALRLEGVVTQADPGSEALRFVIGSGFGRPHLAATFSVLDGEGTAHVAFSAVSDVPGPGGLSGHWRPLSMEHLAQNVGVAAAEAIVRWSQGEELAAAALF